ncbi:Ferritin/ribonucleotide reductase-like protein [uncultured Gammaproteobacteria bacterium]|jgi:hypothetical protein|uniref:Ferritin/ribonucleotide reductase-like protein n=2 Tax=sulfur-oxidizing symbionts TaxID=32036 RepID=A0ACA8ZSK0_9GAMM|nr:Ferritin/ribonucleotide reductase-like protein [Bathymodiolus azoricus thioautotrophic gill symbiont]CAB5499318.1 Ferritin/ribonucleotide reductase-like protein [Bathymodiolus thermophilus thioautotrophic gill symbiont]CAC9502036.1 Ferritin/ribonucleotide reductase-like protein [uncultured Gammaproteobacteria bacterium]CAC9531682.1 Ferritin/ribonucleotide reductase-like protein [uncultured Gammaproteobacteria bacterium]CAC9536328.1 Ferritin/ribonucleotide reductase-like protein [uncultured G
MANEGYHEKEENLTQKTKDMHKAIVSLTEELEAIDWYNQRIDVCQDDDLSAILAHNRDEERARSNGIRVD